MGGAAQMTESAGTAQGVDVALPWGGGVGGAWSVVQTQFLICRTGGCSFGSVGLIFAHVARFWDVGPALAPYWAHVEHF